MADGRAVRLATRDIDSPAGKLLPMDDGLRAHVASRRRNLQMWLLASKSNRRVYVVGLVYELLASASTMRRRRRPTVQAGSPAEAGRGYRTYVRPSVAASRRRRRPIYIGAPTKRNLHHVRAGRTASV